MPLPHGSWDFSTRFDMGLDFGADIWIPGSPTHPGTGELHSAELEQAESPASLEPSPQHPDLRVRFCVGVTAKTLHGSTSHRWFILQSLRLLLRITSRYLFRPLYFHTSPENPAVGPYRNDENLGNMAGCKM